MTLRRARSCPPGRADPAPLVLVCAAVAFPRPRLPSRGVSAQNKTHLHGDTGLVDHRLLDQEVGADRRFVGVQELHIDILVQQRCFPDAGERGGKARQGSKCSAHRQCIVSELRRDHFCPRGGQGADEAGEQQSRNALGLAEDDDFQQRAPRLRHAVPPDLPGGAIFGLVILGGVQVDEFFAAQKALGPARRSR
eukprot:SAG22_NODE_2335_length_2702_cov_10.861698_4_plen_194_part_00